jgi:tetratricopeptide (TPR) repeat protein
MSRFTGIWVVLAVMVLGSASVAAEPVTAWEGTLDLETYPWLDDPYPVFDAYEGAIYYPYTRQDHLLNQKEVRSYRALFLENEYLKITCLPELGGRIHSVWDKTTDSEVFHNPGVIKPALIAMRGAWVAGGIEWNVGPQGHTVTDVSPVDATLLTHDDGSATLVIGNTEKMFRTRWTVRLTLHPGKAYLDESIRMFNPTDGTHTYYFWNNTAFPNLDGTRFIFPMSLGSDHNGEEFFSWPIHEGRDMTWLRNYPTMSSVFAYACDQDFFGAYDVDLDRGIVSHADHHLVQGKKAWTWGEDDFGVVSQMALSDGGPVEAPYIEVQSGPLRTQADYGFLRPHQEVQWREYWYPVHGLGQGFEFANRDIAVNTIRDNNTLTLKLLATGVFTGVRCILTQDGKTLLDQAIDLSPAAPASVGVSDVGNGPVGVRLIHESTTLLEYATPLAITPVSPPDLKAEAAWKQTLPEATQAYMEAQRLDRQNRPDDARAKYEAVLQASPGHVPALTALANLALEQGDYAGAAARCQEALRVDREASEAWYLLGAAQLASGDFPGAMNSGYAVVRGLALRAEGYSLVGRAHMNLGQYGAASEAFRQARFLAPTNTRFRDWWLTARYARGENIAAEVTALRGSEDPTDFTLNSLWALSNPENATDAVTWFESVCGEHLFTLIETVTFFTNLGRYNDAIDILERVKDGAKFLGPLPLYYLAWCHAKTGNEVEGRALVELAKGMPHDYTFPSRPETRPVLAYARSVDPANAHILTAAGCLEAGLRNLDEAVALWTAAIAQPDATSVPCRLLGLDAWKRNKDLAAAADFYRQAIARAGATIEEGPDTVPYKAYLPNGVYPDHNHQVLARDLALILAEAGKTAEAIAFVEDLPERDKTRFDIALWLARAYRDTGRYDDCLALLKSANFTNFEGSAGPHDLFESALLARGKAAYEAENFEGALADFSEALTYPDYLRVGARYVLTDAELRYWQGQCLAKLGRADEAREAWAIGAAQPSFDTPKLPSISVNEEQDRHVKKCAAALEVTGG